MVDDAFLAVKRALGRFGFLMHFDSSLPVTVIACDAVPVGLGEVLSHTMSDIEERPIEFASRSLTRVEKYSHAKKEGLGIIF